MTQRRHTSADTSNGAERGSCSHDPDEELPDVVLAHRLDCPQGPHRVGRGIADVVVVISEKAPEIPVRSVLCAKPALQLNYSLVVPISDEHSIPALVVGN